MRTTLTSVAIALTALATHALSQTPDWTQHFPSSDPTKRAALRGASDGSKMYVYGGNQGAPPIPAHSDLWSYDGATWTQEAAAGAGPSMRENYGLTWDTGRNVLVLFGGRDRSIPADMGDTWEWSPTGGWTQVALTGTTPGPRRWHQLDYFPGLGAVLHGGKDAAGTGVVYDDTWAWNGTTWTQLANGPYKRQRGRMVYRGAPHNDLLYYGGRDEFNAVLNETWSFTWAGGADPGTWTQKTTTTQPGGSTGLYAFGMYYDPIRDRVVTFGGHQAISTTPPEKDWTFEYDGTDWTQVFPVNKPAPRSGLAIAWVDSQQKAFLFGGFGAMSHKDDTWTRDAGTIPGSFTTSGAGCAGTTGQVAALSAPAPPKIGQTFQVDMTNTTPGALPVAVLGLSDTSWALGSLPFALSGLFPVTPAGCNLLVSVERVENMAISGPSSASVNVPIPNNPNFVGASFFVQGLQVELVIADLRIDTTAKGTAVIGG